jgi:hypothetical protein
MTNSVCTYHLSYPRFDYPNNVWRWAQILKLPNYKFSQICHFPSLKLHFKKLCGLSQRANYIERPPPVGEVSAKLCGYRMPRGQCDVFLDRETNENLKKIPCDDGSPIPLLNEFVHSLVCISGWNERFNMAGGFDAARGPVTRSPMSLASRPEGTAIFMHLRI